MTSRERFEAWFLQRLHPGWSILLNSYMHETGVLVYKAGCTQAAWLAWQAALEYQNEIDQQFHLIANTIEE